jgi:hypothetical protein
MKCKYYLFRTPTEVQLVAFSPGRNDVESIMLYRRGLLDLLSFEFDQIGKAVAMPIPKRDGTIGVCIVISPRIEYHSVLAELVERGFTEWPECEIPQPGPE